MRRGGDHRRGAGREDEAWLDSDDNTNPNNNKPLNEARRALNHAAVQLVPFGAQAAASAAAYRSGLVAAQLVGLLLRVSSATPLLGPCLGALGVGFASALAGAAARHARKLCTEGGNPLDRSWWEAPRPCDAALDGALGVVLHRALGGRFASVMPSDLAKPGARALESLPASADGAYAAPGAKRELARLFRRDGCHHCGTRQGPVVGDHMPPNVYVAGPGPGTPNPNGYRGGDLLLEGEKMLARFRAALAAATGGGGGGVKGRGRGAAAAAAANAAAVPARLRQRFYAQCQRCSVRQAVAVRTGRRTLVLHLAPLGPSRPERAAGLVVGLRQGAPALAADSPVAIVAARVGGALSGAAESAAAAVREHRERRRREEAERRREEERRGGGGGKGRGGGGGAAAAGGGGGWGRGGNGNKGGSSNNSGFAAVKADGRLSFAPQQLQEQAMVAWAVVGGGGNGARQQQQQPQPQPRQQAAPASASAAAFAAAAPVQGGLLAGPLYAEFVASAAACEASEAPGWGSAGGGDAALQQQQQRAVAAAAGGPSAAASANAAAPAAPAVPPRCYDAALAAYVSPGGRPRPARPVAEPQLYPPMPLPPQYLSSQVEAAAAAAVVGPSAAVAPAPAPAPAPAAAAPGDLSGVVALAAAAGGPSAEDAKRRAQEAFDRHFARPPAMM